MLIYTQGNHLDAEAEALVNEVNTTGVMGKGMGLQFKHQYPESYRAYKEAADQNALAIGKMLVVPVGGHKYIIHFPTKQHWRSPSKLQWIKDGLADLCLQLNAYHIKSVALPALGCGNGGLSWQTVKPVIEQYLSALDLEVIIYEPTDFAQQATHPTGAATPSKLTPAKALLLWLLYNYQEQGKVLNEVVATALLYFLQRLGETQLQLKFNCGAKGLSSNEVSYLLYTLNGEYLTGYDSNPPGELTLTGSHDEVMQYVSQQTSADTQHRLEQVASLVAPVKTPYGLHLLARVDRLLQTHPTVGIEALHQDLNAGLSQEQFSIEHVQLAARHLLASPALSYAASYPDMSTT